MANKSVEAPVKKKGRPKGSKNKKQNGKKVEAVTEEDVPNLDHKSKVETAIARINKNLGGSAVVRKASDRTYSYNLRRPFGILSLDMATGGGLPAGSICQLFGPEGVGKNYLMNCLIRECQNNYGENASIAYTSFEYGYDKPYGWLCGVSVALSDSEMAEYLSDAGEQVQEEEMHDLTNQVGSFYIIDVGEDGKTIPAESKFQTVLEIVESGLFQLVFIDGLGAFAGQGSRMDGDKRRDLSKLGKVAENARLMTTFLSEAFTLLSMPTESGGMNGTTLVMNNQQRANITTGMNPYQARHAAKTRMGGGYALGHAKAIDIHLRATGKLRVSNKVIGKSVAGRIAKGKLGTHEGLEGEYDYYFGSGVDADKDLVNTAKALKVIETRGPRIYVPGHTKGMTKEQVENYYLGEEEEKKERRNQLVAECLKRSGLVVRNV